MALVLAAVVSSAPSGWTGEATDARARELQTEGSATTRAAGDWQAVFATGESALRGGDLEAAESSFKKALKLNPKAAYAYANLGVIAMRRKQWQTALDYLGKAEELAPEVPGIRLNIGLTYYRRNDFRHAIPPFESVVKEQPDSLQARYLLGQCYFFTYRYVEATDTLLPLWPRQSRDLNYLYVLAIAADKAERKELGDRALARLAEVGDDSAEVHLLMGKAMLTLAAYDDALKELTAALLADPKLPFAHFNLGMVYSKKGEYERAKAEFLTDIALEPDVEFNYAELANVYFLMENDVEAEKSYRQALQLDPQLLDAYLGLAKLFQRQGQNEKALAELDRAGKLDPNSSRIHYLRGQILIKIGRLEEGRKELQTSVAMSSASREKREKEMEGEAIPNPEIRRDPK
jgi:tetratricopeptide (TPR) repeat protein